MLSAESHSSRGYGSGVRRIGLLGGMSWESSVEYERVINREVRARCGGVASADLVVRSLDFSVIEQLQANDRWEEAGDVLAAAAIDLERAGAEVIVLCTNTMHRVIDRIEAAVSAEVLHIADATAEAARRAGVADLVLLGTRYTMEADFYAGRLRERHGLTVRVPGEADRAELHRIIYEELVVGVIDSTSKQRVVDMVERCVADGATGVIAGCTEIELLIGPDDVPVEFLPTARLHALAAVDRAFAD